MKRGCHQNDSTLAGCRVPSTSLLKHLLKGEGGAIKMTELSPTALGPFVVFGEPMTDSLVLSPRMAYYSCNPCGEPLLQL